MWPGGMEFGDSAPAAEPVVGTVFGDDPTIGPAPDAGLAGLFGSAAMWPGGIELTGSGPEAFEFETMPGGDVTMGPGPVGRPGPCSEPVIGAPVGEVVCPCIPVPCAS